MAELRELTKELCDKCIFMPVVKENGCSYMTLTGHSRIFTNGQRVVPNGYCDKFQEGDRCHSYHGWKASDLTLIFSDKGGQVYEKRYCNNFTDIDDNSIDG